MGSALALRLGETQHQVSLLVRKNTNLCRILDLSPFKIGRFETDQEIDKFIAEECPDVVIHTACCYGRNGESPIQIIDSNIRFGTLILNSIKSIEKKIYFLNAATVLPKEVSFYSLTKIQFEEFGSYFAGTSNSAIQFLNLKLHHMYGPGDDASKFTSHVINSCKNNLPKLSLTLGEQKRDFIYIDDVLDAYERILENIGSLDGRQQIELGTGTSSRLRDFVEIVHKATNSKTELLFGEIPYRENDVMCMEANIDNLKTLGWSPKFDIEAGIKKIIGMDSVK